jgi:hypothetical protein
MLYSELGSKRDEYLLETFTLRTSGACAASPDPACGLNATKVTDAVITSPRAGLPVLIAGTFDNVDIKSEARRDELKTIFRQTTLLATQRFRSRPDRQPFARLQPLRLRQPGTGDRPSGSVRRQRLPLRLQISRPPRHHLRRRGA